jgi:hypothetical protein
MQRLPTYSSLYLATNDLFVGEQTNRSTLLESQVIGHPLGERGLKPPVFVRICAQSINSTTDMPESLNAVPATSLCCVLRLGRNVGAESRIK